ncbi:GH32 C-terminal domain-containing protein [Hallella multisaccharivorax]|uniref:GH32 C-terminal domain-containing protein n=1 Tax=Hallella multisaccharivorax TaxID=310514 RepID=UPI0036137D36
MCFSKFNRIAKACVLANEKKLKLHIFVDKSSIELFAGDGEKVFTLLIYAAKVRRE